MHSPFLSGRKLLRRTFLGTMPMGLGVGCIPSSFGVFTSSSYAQQKDFSPEDVLGITTGSLNRFWNATHEEGKIRLLDLPRMMRTRLKMRVIDLMTANFPSFDPKYLRSLKEEAVANQCILTNLKMNQPGLVLGSESMSEHRKAIDQYKQTMESAAILGVKWVRPLPSTQRPHLGRLVESFRELIEFGKPLGIQLLIENFGWISSDPLAIPTLIKEIGIGVSAQPDTGNWVDNETRYAGLEKAFPFAASCDFKVRAFDQDRQHREYDLKRCFDIGWEAGFRGPWCFEHFHHSLEGLIKEMIDLRELLRRWIQERSSSEGNR